MLTLLRLPWGQPRLRTAGTSLGAFCGLHSGPGRVCLEIRSWWCHGQAQERAPAPRARSPRVRWNKGYEALGRDRGSRELVVFHAVRGHCLFQRESPWYSPTAQGAEPVPFVVAIKIICSTSRRSEALGSSRFVPHNQIPGNKKSTASGSSFF